MHAEGRGRFHLSEDLTVAGPVDWTMRASRSMHRRCVSCAICTVQRPSATHQVEVRSVTPQSGIRIPCARRSFLSSVRRRGFAQTDRASTCAYAGDDHARGVLSGDRVILAADIATSFGVVVHELATNAARYAALSSHISRVGLTWSVDGGNEGPVLKVVWTEDDGPQVRRADKPALGSQLIKQGISTG